MTGDRHLFAARKLLTLTSQDESEATFECLLDEGRDGLLLLGHTDWEEMGRPDEITITIVPGDTLNEEG